MRGPEATDEAAARRLGVLGVEHAGEGLQHLVAMLGGARAGADDLDQQRLRVLGVIGQGGQKGAHAGPDPLPRIAAGALGRGHHCLDDDVGGEVKEGEHALLLVGEVLVEGRFGHPRPTADRL